MRLRYNSSTRRLASVAGCAQPSPTPRIRTRGSPCSVGARAVWVVDTQDSSVPGFFAIVNGSSTDLSRPFAMIYYQNPAHRAAQIRVAHLRYSGPPNQMPRTLPDEQLWGKAPGPLS